MCSGSLREALYETLSGILSPHTETRQAAEQRIQALEVTEEFGIHLTEFVVDPNGHLPIRQLASVLLKQYVETHWSSVAEKFRPPEIKYATKERIKELLPIGLRESISKVRAAVAYAISAIAHWDWPENWPGLFDILVSCLSGESEYAVHGAMRVLTEFTSDLTDNQLPNVGPVILQEMYRIFQSENQYSIRIRSRAVEIFTTITSLVAVTELFQKGFAERYLQPVIPMFCEKFVYCLRLPDGSTCDSGLKTDVIKAINCLVTRLPKYIATFLPQMLPPFWETLVQSAKLYQEGSVNGEGDTNEKEVDSDGEIINFNNLIIAIFEFVHSIVDRKRFSNLLDSFLQEVMYYLIIFMQITDDQIELWTTSPNQFVEEDDVLTYNVRISAQELLTALVNYSEEKAVNALCEVVTRHIEATSRLQTANNGSGNSETCWKLRESSILALSKIKDVVVERQKAGMLQFDIIRFLDTIVLATLKDSGSPPLLLGRCLCIGGKYAEIMPPEMSSRFLEATVNGLQENQPSCIRISAVKAIYWFCKASVAENNSTLGNIIRSHLPNIFQGLFNLANQTSTEIFTLVMETFQVLVSLDKAFTASVENKICPLTIAAFLKFYSDHEILDLCQDIFKSLTQNPDCIGPLQTRLIPTLTSMMAVSPMDKLKDERCRNVALDVLQVLVQYSPKPLSSALVETAFPAACHCILNSEDNETLQSGGEVIRAYLAVAARQVTVHRDNDGQTGLQYILQIIAQLLNPQSSEFTATFVGRLVTTLIRKAGNTLGENLDLLLKAVLSKMQRAQTLTVVQSLLMVYAHLINTEFDAVLNFLSTVPGPTGQSALTFVLSEWVTRQHLFFGKYDRKVATVALCKILEYGVTHDDSRLNEIIVRGDQIFPGNEEGVRTRSKAESQPYQWTTIPVLVKIFKLIINELSNDIEAVAAGHETDDSYNDDGDEDEVTYLDPGYENMIILGETMPETEEDEDDPDLLQDSIYHLNLSQYLQDFLLNFSTHHCFPVYIQHLNIPERKVLSSLNINASFMQ
ncbi:importin-9 isoform X2 [Bombus pyrosoma]|uniref:importin-9 isoform X2 n=1 Tax=Bombus pyrosoma TaxID=396416 RepID=UPI001CB93F7C|nr:importin-9 isoform X2 [Bombus pyrosoma]XP_043599550.1 importin-9 isoform X2 [Bombus pyrosoma]XP_043599561.1 importin-9 isoform X2 [Bombus pyrosoma]